MGNNASSSSRPNTGKNDSGFHQFEWDRGQWGPTGNAEEDFKADGESGYLFNPTCREQARLAGDDARTVAQANTAADGWLSTSFGAVHRGEELITTLQNASQSRALTQPESQAIAAASDGCESLNSTWSHLGPFLQKGVTVCHKHQEAGNKTEDCRRLWGRVMLARSRGMAQIGAGSRLGDPQPTCATIQTLLLALRQGAQ